MADDPNPALRTELMAQLATLNPQIRGLHDLSAVSISADLKQAVAEQIVERERRRDLTQAVVDALDHVVAALRVLESDGYPTFPTSVIPQPLFEELQRQASDLQAAIAVSQAEQAAKIGVTLGQPVPKT
jgi:hypothetical protein